MAAEFSDILAALQKRLQQFTKTIPAAQRSMYDAITEEINRLELFTDGTVKASVKNMGILNSIRNKINRVVLTDDYRKSVKDFAGAFNEITKLQNDYWRSVEVNYSPTPILREIRKSAITDTVGKLTEAGIGANVSDKIIEILRTNITSGGSYKDLASQLRDGLLNTEQKGYLDRYARQVATDSINQYNAQYTQQVSSDLGYTWYKYDNTDIETTRPFCDHMTDQPYFHISQVPGMLRGETTTGQVPLYDKTKLPMGMIPGTNPENFFTRRGGYNCGHQIRPVNDKQVPADIRAAVYASAEYQLWAGKTGAPKTPPPAPTPPKPAAQQPLPPPAKGSPFQPVKSVKAGKASAAAIMSQKAGIPVGKVTVSNELSLEQFNRRLNILHQLTGEYKNIADFGGANVPIDLSFRSTTKYHGVVYRRGLLATNETKNITGINFGHTNDEIIHRRRNPYINGQGKATLKHASAVDPENIDLSTTVHEFAHVISTQNDARRADYPPEQKKFWSELGDLRAEYNKQILEYSAQNENAKLQAYHIGQYASTNINEFMAEGFTEYKLSSDPSPMAKKIGKLIDEYFKK